MTTDRRIFLKQLGLGTVGLGLASSFSQTFAASPMPGGLPRSTPEAQGVSSAEILDFLEAFAKSPHELHSFMMVRHGKVMAEGWVSPYRRETNQMLYSLSKSFTSTAIGFAVAEGRMKVEDTVISFFPNDLPDSLDGNLMALQVKHLLTMSVGHPEDVTPIVAQADNWVKTFLALPIENPPGSAFVYTSIGTYMLSAIVQKLTGQKVVDYLRPRLFEPLGITGMTWETCPHGINTGGWGLAIQTEGLAKFGQFYLQKGRWNGQQLLPADWIETATTFKIQQPAAPGKDLADLKQTSDWHQGYGYQFWRCRHHCFRGDGAFGQFTIVMPDQDAVVCLTCETHNMATELELVWQYLLPAIKREALPPDAAAQARLTETLSGLTLRVPQVQSASPVAAQISGKTFKVAGNADVQSVSFQFQKNSCTFSLRDAAGDHPIKCGIGHWIEGQTDMPGTPPKLTVGPLGPVSPVAASGTWTDDHTFQMTWHFYNTPHHDTVTCHFDSDSVRIEFLNSVTAMSPSHQETRPPLLGQIIG